MSIVHLTTVHHRTDVRIVVRQLHTLASKLKMGVLLVVADGEGSGSVTERIAILDIGRMGTGRWPRMSAGAYRAFCALRRINPDLIHFHDPELIPVALVLRLFGHKVIYDVHEDVPRQILSKQWLPAPSRRLIASLVEGIEWISGHAFDAIVAATPTIARRFPTSKTTVVHNYPGSDELVPKVVVEYKDRPRSFAYIGHIAEVRGIEEVIKALETVKDTQATLELAGSVSPDTYLRRLSAMSGWEAVRYHGVIGRTSVAEILGTVRAGLVVHHPTPNEVHALPMKLFEYMLLGLPVIASDFPPLRAIVTAGRCGLLVNPRSVKEVADAMRWILNNPLEAAEMGSRAKGMAQENYCWSSEAAKLLSLYRRLLPDAM